MAHICPAETRAKSGEYEILSPPRKSSSAALNALAEALLVFRKIATYSKAMVYQCKAASSLYSENVREPGLLQTLDVFLVSHRWVRQGIPRAGPGSGTAHLVVAQAFDVANPTILEKEACIK